MAWQVSLACVSFLTVDPLVLKSLLLALLIPVPIMLPASTHQITWVINANAHQGGKVRKFCIQSSQCLA